MALPASALDTTTTVTVPSGTIGISSVPASAALGSVTPGTTATVTLTGVKVEDNRAGEAGWTATVSSTQFEGAKESVLGTPDNIISAANASYTAGTATVSGTATVTAAAKQADLSAVKTVQTATAVTGNNTATWNGTLELAVPSNAIADDYTAVVTHSAS
jgi:hypothetical protein